MPKPKIEKRSVKHIFTPEEIAQRNLDFRAADRAIAGHEADLDAMKASFKAKITEAEARKEKIGTELDAGFEMREENCVLVMDFKAGEKRYFIERLCDENFRKQFPNELEWSDEMAVLIEPMTDADRQQELLEAEAKFECKEEIELFPAASFNGDSGYMTVGRLNGKWYSALKVKIGAHTISESIADEQAVAKSSGSKKRSDQINRTLKRFSDWLTENLGRDEAKGFKNQIELVKAEHAEREE